MKVSNKVWVIALIAIGLFAGRVYSRDPINISTTQFAVVEDAVTVANTDLGNANTSYTYLPLAKEGFNAFAAQYTIQNTTITFQASNSLKAVSDASANWTDVTSLLTSGAASTITATGSMTISEPLPWNRMRIVRLTTNSTNALTLNVTKMLLR